MVELLGDGEGGEVRLGGVTNTLGMYYFPKIIEAFKKKISQAPLFCADFWTA